MNYTLRAERSEEEVEELRQRDREYHSLKRKDCPVYKEKRSQHYFENKSEYQRIIKNSNLKRKYGITLNEYKQMVEKQAGRCTLCDRLSNSLHVDHCHKTNKIRGLLCGSCNRALGLFQDDPRVLEKAKEYVS